MRRSLIWTIALAVLALAGWSHDAAAQAISVSPSPLDFGNVDASVTQLGSFTIANTDAITALTITNITEEPAAGDDCDVFALGTLPVFPQIVSLGNDLIVDADFSPVTAGERTCTVAIESDTGGTSNTITNLVLRGTGQRVLVVSSPALDFGNQLVANPPAQLGFDITNRSDAPYTLLDGDVALSGDAAFSLAASPAGTVLAAGASTTVTVVFDPAARGELSGAIAVTATSLTDPATETVDLAGVGQAPAMTVDPLSLDFAPRLLTDPASPNQTITISNASGADVSDLDVTIGLSAGDTGDFSFAPLSGTVPPGGSLEVSVSFKPTATGNRAATLTIDSNDTATPAVDVALAGTGQEEADIALAPAAIDFGSQTVGQDSAPQAISISNAAGAFRVPLAATLTVEGNHPADFLLSSNSETVPAGESRLVDVTFHPTAPGDRSARIRVDSNDPAQPLLAIDVSGVGTQPDILVQPGSLAFGDVGVSQASAPQTVSVRNNGNADLVITGVTIGGITPGDFTFSGPTNITLTPGQSRTWDVTCAPTVVGPKDAALQFPSNDPDTSVGQVSLSCTGVSADLALVGTLAFPDTDVGDTAQSITVDLRNAGTQAARVTAITSTNSVFSVTNTPTLPFVLDPLQSVPVTVSFTPADNVRYAAELRVTADETSASFPMTGRGIVAEMDVVPDTYDFGDVRVGLDSLARTFTISNIATAPFTVSDISIDNAESFVLSVQDALPVTLAPSPSPDASTTFQITAAPQTIGAITATVTVQTNIAGASTAEVQVTVNGIAPVLSLSQSGIDFGGVDVQALAPAQRVVTVTNTGSLELAISNVEIQGEGAAWFSLAQGQVRSTVVPVGGTFDVTVDYQPTVERARELDASLVISSNALDVPSAVVPLGGHGIDRHISVSALSLEFPETYRNPVAPARLPLEITNTGEAPLALTMIVTQAQGGDAFSVEEPTAAIVAPGETEVLNVLFAPTAASGAPFRGTLTIVNDDDDEPMVEVALRGLGVTPQVAMSPGAGVTLSGGVGVPVRLSEAGERIRVLNLDDAPFTVREVVVAYPDGSPMAPEDAPFQVVGFAPGTVLAPAASLDLDVVFRAPAPGSYEALVQVYLDGDPLPVSFVTVRGEAIDVTLHGGGCGVASAPGSRAGALWAGLLLAWMLARRRRARPGPRTGPALPKLPTLGSLVLVSLASHTGWLPRAHADDARNLDLSTFRPAPGVEVGMLSVEGPAVGAPGAWAVGLALHHARNPLVVESAGARMSDAPITARTAAELGFAYAFGGRYEAGLVLPLLQQDGEAPAFSGLAPAQGAALGDVAVHGKAAVWQDPWQGLWQGGRMALASSATLSLPTATDGAFAGSNGPSLHARGIAGLSTRRVRVAANAGLRLRGKHTLANIEQGSELTYGVAGAYRVRHSLTAVGELFGAAGVGAAGAVSALEGTVGMRYRPDRRLAVAAGVGRGLISGIGAPDLRAFLLVSYSPQAHEVPLLVVPEAASPRRADDEDGDGIVDDDDRCPGEKEDVDGFEDTDGCLDPDNDDDGIIDRTDQCPDIPEDYDGFQDDDGCPEGDNDQDGIPDVIDQCPDIPEDYDGFQDTDGCDDPDNDRDGIPDVIDQCPLEAETINGKQDLDGCPDEGEGLVLLLNDRIELLQPIEFRRSKRVTRRSETVIGQVAAVLRAHPELVRVRIGVHVNASGSRDQSVSESRAQVLKELLVKRGVAPERLDAMGYGSSRPLLPPQRRGARDLNERVELVIEKKEPGGQQ